MIGDPPTLSTPSVNEVSAALYLQIMSVMGLGRLTWATRFLYPIFHLPILRLSRLLVELDSNISLIGWNSAVNHFTNHLVSKLQVDGQDYLPTQGSLLVISNHPAALDVAILAATINREDLKILASDIPIIQLHPHLAAHIIPVYYDIPRRLQTVRNTIRHLKQGGSIFLFPRGNVEPDPLVSPGALQSLDGWSPSIELFLRQVPETTTVVASAWGMLSSRWYKNPLINCWKKYEQRQKVAEIFQIASQLFTGKTPSATPSVKFSTPLSLADLGGENAPQGTLLAKLVARERQMLADLPAL